MMKRNMKVVFSILLIVMVPWTFACGQDKDAVPKSNIKEFLQKKSELYDQKDEIIASFNNGTFEELFIDVKVLLTQREYE